MGFWSGLGKGLLAAAPIVAAPFTGGASLAATGAGGILGKIGKIASAAAPALAGMTAGAQKGREAENTAAQNEAAFKLKESQGAEQAMQDRAKLDLAQRQFGQSSQNNAFQQALRSSLLKNIKDVKIGNIGNISPVQISGGMRPSAMGPEGLAAAGLMNDKAMASLMSGEKFNSMAPLERIAPPTFKKPGTFENIMGGLAAGTGAISGGMAANQQQTLQQKIMDAIEKLSGPQAPPVSVQRPTTGSEGVTPFTRPPTATFPPKPPVNPYDDGQ